MKAAADAGRHPLIRILARFRRRWLLAFAVGIAAHLAFGASEPLLLLLLKPVFEGEGALSLWLPAAIVGIFFIRTILWFGAAYLTGWVSENFNRAMRREMAAHIMRLPLAYHQQESSGVLISRVIGHLDAVRKTATGAFPALLQSAAKVAGYAGFLIWIDWRLALAAFALAPLALPVVRYFGRRAKRLFRRANEQQAEITGHLNEIIRAARIIKAFGGAQAESGRFDARADRLYGARLRAAAAKGLSPAIVQLIAALGFALALTAGIFLHNSGEVSRGDLGVFMGAMMLLPIALRRLVRAVMQMSEGLAGAERVFGLLDYAPESDRGGRTLGRAAGAISFCDVGFRYPGGAADALDGFSLEVKAGETVALAGRSGSGKTTAVSLLLRFYAPERGKILLDGGDIAALALADLRRQFALVSQDIFLFNDTVARNIAYPDSVPDLARARAAAKSAQALDFINALPRGMETVVGEDGMTFSGGQRQRLALARAFYKDAPILILDEATSALDSQTEAAVRRAVEELRRGRTAIIIAHRLATIEQAQKIAVIEKGKVAALGDHVSLIAESPIYAAFYQTQRLRETEEEQ